MAAAIARTAAAGARTLRLEVVRQVAPTRSSEKIVVYSPNGIVDDNQHYVKSLKGSLCGQSLRSTRYIEKRPGRKVPVAGETQAIPGKAVIGPDVDRNNHRQGGTVAAR
jgi:hypothetical protein